MPMYGSTFSPVDDFDTTALTTVPEVAQALTDLQAAYDRYRAAAARERELWRIARDAPQQDVSAVMEAVSAGAAKLPAPTEKKAAEAHAEADRVLQATIALALQAEDRVRAAVDTHREQLRTAQTQRLEAAADKVITTIDLLADTMREAGLEGSRMFQVGDDDTDPLSQQSPLRWEIYDSRYDGNMDPYLSLDLLREFANNVKPSVAREKRLKADTAWEATINGTNPDYQPVPRSARP
jgi:hypothetical protein